MPLKKDTDDIPDSTVESPDVIPNTTDSQGKLRILSYIKFNKQ